MTWATTNTKHPTEKSPRYLANRLLAACTLALAALAGCSAPPDSPNRNLPSHADSSPQPIPAPNGKFARLDPQQLDDSLTQDQLKRMALHLQQIPDTPLFPADPNHPDTLAHALDQLLPSTPTPPDLAGDNASILAQKAYLRAKRLLNQARARLALDQIAFGLAAEPNNPALYELLAKDYEMAENAPYALAAAQKTIQLDPDRLIPYRIAGDNALAAGLAHRAAAIFRHALQSPQATPANPLTALLQLRLAQALDEQGYLAAAATQYRNAYRLLRQQAAYSHDDPALNRVVRQAHLPLMTLAHVRLRMGQIDLAAKALQQAAQLFGPDVDIDNAFILYIASSAQPLNVRYQQVHALAKYLLAAQNDRQNTLTSFYQACQKMAKFDQYHTTIQSWHTNTTGNDQLPLLSLRQYAHALLLAGDHQAAENALLKQLAQGRQIDLVHRDLGKLYAQIADTQRMILHFGQFLQLDPDNARNITTQCLDAASRLQNLNQQLHDAQTDDVLTADYGPCFLLGALARHTQQDLLAQHFYRRTLQLRSTMRLARTALIELLLQQKQYKQTLKVIKDADPDDPHMIRYAGHTYAGLNQLDLAANAYRRLADIQPDDYLTYLDLADILARQHAFPAAEQILLKVLASRTAVPDAYQALFVLYARWNAQPDLTDTFRQHTGQRARRMLRQALATARQADDDLPDATDTPQTEQTPLDPLTSQHLLPTLENLAREYPTGRVIGLMLTELYLDRNLNDLAARQIEKTLKAHPRDDHVLSLAARAAEARNDLQHAVHLRRQLHDLHPDDPARLAHALATLRVAGQPQKALELLLHAASKPQFLNTARDSSLPYEALRTLAASRDYPQALAFFQQWHELACPPADTPQTHHDQPNQPADQSEQPTTDHPSQTPQQDRPDQPGPLAIAQNLLWALTENCQYDHAARHARQLHQHFMPKQDWATLYLARSLTVRRQYDHALNLLNDLLSIQPENHALRLQLLLTLLAADQPDQARSHAQTWYQQQPDLPKNRSLYLFTLGRTNAHDQSIQLLQNLLQDHPASHKLRLALFDAFLDAARYDDADMLLEKLTKEQKKSNRWISPQVTLDIARDQSQATLARLDRLDPAATSDQVQSLKARILAATGQVQQAADTLQNLLQNDPNNLDLQVRYTTYLQLAGRDDLAIDTLQHLRTQYPHESLLQNNLAYALTETCQQLDHAQQLLQRSLSTDPLSGPTLDSAGWLYYKRADFEQALTYLYQAAAAMVTPDPEVYDHLGDAYYQLQRLPQAKHAWTVALRELTRRAAVERFLVADLERVQKKLNQLEQNQNVDTAPTCGGF